MAETTEAEELYGTVVAPEVEDGDLEGVVCCRAFTAQ